MMAEKGGKEVVALLLALPFMGSNKKFGKMSKNQINSQRSLVLSPGIYSLQSSAQ